MIGKLVSALVAFVLVHAAAPPAESWNGKGHMVVAFIAYQHLDPEVKRKVARLLRRNPDHDRWTDGVADADKGLVAFMMASTWPDDIKRERGYVSDGDRNGDVPAGDPEDAQNIGYADHLRHKYWHFVDTPFSTDGTALKHPPTPNALTEIKLLRTALRESHSNDIRSYDLVWLEHLVGDVHQPLHATSRFTRNHPDGDAGGNLVPLCAKPCKNELHAFWDSLLGEADLDAAMRLGEELDSEPAPADPNATNVEKWIAESFALAKQEAYKPPISTDEPNSAIGKPNKAYRNNARDVAEQQVLLAGHRLARLINDALR